MVKLILIAVVVGIIAVAAIAFYRNNQKKVGKHFDKLDEKVEEIKDKVDGK